MRMCRFTLDDETIKEMTVDEAQTLTMKNGMFKEYKEKKIKKVEFYNGEDI